jgi:REP-associated tyrosine transposase
MVGATTNRETNGPVTLGRVIQYFKSKTTVEYVNGVRDLGWDRFPGRLWQQNYYEHVVRNDFEFDRIRTYIEGNPGKWTQDAEYRANCKGFG